MFITEAQDEAEIKIMEIFLSGVPDAEQKIVEVLESGIFSAYDIQGYNYRKDRPPRPNMVFIQDIIDRQKKEHETFLYFCRYNEDKGRKVEWEAYGTDINGRVMIANFKKRNDSPAKPDYKMKIDGKVIFVESKNFWGEHLLKIDNLRNYKEYNACMIVGNCNRYYLYKRKAMSYLLENVKKPIEKGGKLHVIVNRTGQEANFSIKTLIEKGLVKEL